MNCYYLEVVVNLNGHCKGCSGPITSHFSVALDRKEEGGPSANWRQPGPAVEVISHENIDCLLLSKFGFQVVEYKNFQDYNYQIVVMNRSVNKKLKKMYIYIKEISSLILALLSDCGVWGFGLF